jgi:hypothetical protein
MMVANRRAQSRRLANVPVAGSEYFARTLVPGKNPTALPSSPGTFKQKMYEEIAQIFESF